MVLFKSYLFLRETSGGRLKRPLLRSIAYAIARVYDYLKRPSRHYTGVTLGAAPHG